MGNMADCDGNAFRVHPELGVCACVCVDGNVSRHLVIDVFVYNGVISTVNEGRCRLEH
jgi:hypothetical protein